MANKITEEVANVGSYVADAAKNVGQKIAQGADKAVDFVLHPTESVTNEGVDSGIAGIREKMEVIASCGKKIGVVDRVEADSIKLTRNDSPDDQHHFIPLSWVSHVDSHVHLTCNSKEAVEGWKSNSSSCGCET